MIGNILKAHRVKHNLYQTEMAKLIGCTNANYCKIEGGKVNPKWNMVQSILRVVAPTSHNELLLLDMDADNLLSKKKNIKRIKV